MKRIIALSLMLLTVFYSFSFFAFADEGSKNDNEILTTESKDTAQNLQSEDILSFSCHYLPDTKP